MKLNAKVEDALNQQINSELLASYTYLAMAAYFDHEELPGFASWFKAHSVEETSHAMRIYEFINRRDGQVKLMGIEQPATAYDSPEAVLEKALKMEKQVTQQIHNLFEISNTEKEYGTQNMLQWFLEEQVEEEDLFRHVLTQVKAAGGDRWNLLLLDQQLGARKEGED